MNTSIPDIKRRVRLALTLALAAFTFALPAAESRWWKGNLHTHTLWSDGDDYPEMVVGWYKDHGYHFLSLSDHNRLQQGEYWINATNNRGGPAALERYLARHGTQWVERRTHQDQPQVRLKTLAEFRALFEEPGRFLLIQGEEISDHFEKRPLHLNATNLRDLIPPQGGKTVAEVLQNNINAVLDQRRRTGQPMIPHINHPNFGWALTAEDMVELKGERFFEVYNGHPGVRNYGDATHAGTERIWDILLTRRLAELRLDPIWGTAVDDAHAYHSFNPKASNPGRGWIMVRAPELSAAALIAAMERGDFYASTGVELTEVRRGPRELGLEIKAEPGVTYLTRFIGTRKGYNPASEPVLADGRPVVTTRRYSPEIGTVLAEVRGATPRYQLKGDEIYVRATVVSSKLKSNPFAVGDYETAWVQPLVPE